MQWSPYQQNVFNWLEHGEGHGIIEAVAGSGKTTTIVEGLKYARGESLLLAFNKTIAEELKARIPWSAEAGTFHSAGFRIIRQHAGRVKVENNKLKWLAKDHFTDDEDKRFGWMAGKLVSLAKQTGIGAVCADSDAIWEELIDHFDLEPTYPEDLPYDCIPLARRLLKLSNKDKRIDFDDMIYRPLYEGWKGASYDFVFIDEAQDTNVVRRALAESLLAPNGRLVAVGDPHQAIYGFTGASSDAMQQIAERHKAEVLPLHISYRSDKAIIRQAQSIVPHIQHRDDAGEGVVQTTTFAECPPRSQDVILCRNNAPLIDLAFNFIRRGVGVQVRGRDIGQGLVDLIEKQKAKGIDALLDKLYAYREREVQKFMKKDNQAMVQQVEDKVDTILILIDALDENHRTVPELVRSIERLFSDSLGRGLLTLSTIHKAKGLEWDRVYLYRPELIPAKYARREWQLEQEYNLKYVAITRARHEFYYVVED